MITTVILWSYMLVLSVIFGLTFLRLLSVLVQSSEAHPTSLPIVSITGIVVITTITGFFSLFLPVSWEANLFVIFTAILLLAFQRKHFAGFLRSNLTRYRQYNPLVLILLGVIFFITLIRTVEPPVVYDVGLYYAQSIRWIEEYPAIPGLGNLHARLAFNSSWFLPSALFSFAFLGGLSYHVLGGFFYLLVYVFLLEKVNSLIGGSYSFSNIAALTSGFLLGRYFRYDLSSPVNDMPAALLVWLVVLLSIDKIERGEDRQFDWNTLLIVIFSLFAITIKISIAPLLFIPLYFLLRSVPSVRASQVLGSFVLAVVLWLPWLARGVIQSGYILFPISALDIFNVPWKVPKDVAQNHLAWIASWARLQHPDKDMVLSMPLRNWAPIWFTRLNPIEKQLYIAICVGFLVLIFASLIRAWNSKAEFKEYLHYVFLYLAIFSGTAFWFFNAPAFRFGIGFTGSLFVLLVSPPIKWLVENIRPAHRQVVFSLFVVFFVYHIGSAYTLWEPSRLREGFVQPVDYFQADIGGQLFQNLIIYTPVNDERCWYTPLPCTPTVHRGLTPMGNGLEDGFYIPSDP